jgi:hypothetical protein
MAKVTITIEDTEKTGIHLTIESDPPFPGPAAEDQTQTNAQYLGCVAMDAMSKACGHDDGSDEEEDL